MTPTARLLALLAVIFLAGACSHSTAPGPEARKSDGPGNEPPASTLQTSPRRLVGRVLALDAARGFAFVDLAASAPAAALADGAELIARTDELRETGRLRVSRYLRGRTLGTTIISGQPSPGDEVVSYVP